jgi:hypothetical protein
MVMFEYSEKPEPVAVEKTIDQQLYERPMSKVVQRAISREMGSLPVKKLEKVSSQVEAKNILKEHAEKFRLCSRCDGYYVFTNECPPVISIEIVEEN